MDAGQISLSVGETDRKTYRHRPTERYKILSDNESTLRTTMFAAFATARKYLNDEALIENPEVPNDDLESESESAPPSE